MEGTHYVGQGSSFDADMSLIESFIKNKNEPDNYLAQLATFDYYKSRLISYWLSFEEYIMSENATEHFAYDPDDMRTGGGVIHDPTRADLKRVNKYGISNRDIGERSRLYKNATNQEDDIQTLYPLEGSDLDQIIRPSYEDNLPSPLSDKISTRMVRRMMSVYEDKEIEFIREHLDFYRQRFLTMIDEAVDRFEKVRILELSVIHRLVKFITALMCLFPTAQSFTQ